MNFFDDSMNNEKREKTNRIRWLCQTPTALMTDLSLNVKTVKQKNVYPTFPKLENITRNRFRLRAGATELSI